MSELVTLDYKEITTTWNKENAWFNATLVEEQFGKNPHDWFRLPSSEEYIEIYCRINDTRKSHIVKTKKDGSSTAGTWLHPDLVFIFASWISAEFAVWCDKTIKDLLPNHIEWERVRSASASSAKIMTDMLKLKREQQGKTTPGWRYSNEFKMINQVLTGERGKLDRESLSLEELDMLIKLQGRNAVLIGLDKVYKLRKEELQQFFAQLNSAKESIHGKINLTYQPKPAA